MFQSRRMRSDELHYIDHPLFGIVVRINRFTPEA
ncbi:MAG: CsiV family protein [Candidatus Azotimanducaceae bacterium WSBS_2022_MAG_OTU7]